MAIELRSQCVTVDFNDPTSVQSPGFHVVESTMSGCSRCASVSVKLLLDSNMLQYRQISLLVAPFIVSDVSPVLYDFDKQYL